METKDRYFLAWVIWTGFVTINNDWWLLVPALLSGLAFVGLQVRDERRARKK